MLVSLRIKNFVIIKDATAEFEEGFNVITGETGAGKSILLGALDLLIGGKASHAMIRAGETEALVEAHFEIPGHVAGLPELELNSAGVAEIVLSRKVQQSGRSRVYINGSSSTLSMLQTIGPKLVSVFGQHEQNSLLDPSEHMEILDGFGALYELRSKVGAAYSESKKAADRLKAAQAHLDRLNQNNLDNKAVIRELTEAELREGEEDELTQEKETLKKAVQIREKAFESHKVLYADSGCVLEKLADVRKKIEFIARCDPAFDALGANFEEALFRIEDAAGELRTIAKNYRADPRRLERIEDRLALIRRLKKKYGMSLPQLIIHMRELEGEASDTLKAENEVKKRMAEADAARAEFIRIARTLSESRRAAAAALELTLKEELKDLAMPHAVLSTRFTEAAEEKAGPDGLETVEFLLASNPGEPPRPLAAIASGGEVSRIMLAVRSQQSEDRLTPTVIFDEADTGIGGHTAYAVGRRLARIAQRRQVLCITHLHQIAAAADHHFTVEKTLQDDRTAVHVRKLSGEERVEELARMLGASPENEAAKEHVRELMTSAETGL